MDAFVKKGPKDTDTTQGGEKVNTTTESYKKRGESIPLQSHSGPLVILVGDNSRITTERTRFLIRHGHRVVRAICGREALDIVSADTACIVSEIELSDMSGFDLAGRLRALTSAPILFLAAGIGDEQVAYGFEHGDDVMTHPGNLLELALRIDAQIRRRYALHAMDRMSYPPLVIDKEMRLVWVNGHELPLTPKEFSILTVLARAPNQPMSVENVFHKVWIGNAPCNRHVLAVNVSTLRKHLAEVVPGRNFIRTEWGFGYTFVYPPIPIE